MAEELCPGIIFPSPYPQGYGDTRPLPSARHPAAAATRRSREHARARRVWQCRVPLTAVRRPPDPGAPSTPGPAPTCRNALPRAPGAPVTRTGASGRSRPLAPTPGPGPAPAPLPTPPGPVPRRAARPPDTASPPHRPTAPPGHRRTAGAAPVAPRAGCAPPPPGRVPGPPCRARASPRRADPGRGSARPLVRPADPRRLRVRLLAAPGGSRTRPPTRPPRRRSTAGPWGSRAEPPWRRRRRWPEGAGDGGAARPDARPRGAPTPLLVTLRSNGRKLCRLTGTVDGTPPGRAPPAAHSRRCRSPRPSGGAGQ